MTVEAWKKCPVCGKTENQVRAGYNGSGSQRCKCKECGKYYTINPKQHTYPEETRKLALKMYYGGISGRSVGKILHMNKSNVMNWIKKASCKENSAPKQTLKIVEMDELYWFLKYKPRTKTRGNRDYPEFCVTAKMRCKIELNISRRERRWLRPPCLQHNANRGGSQGAPSFIGASSAAQRPLPFEPGC